MRLRCAAAGDIGPGATCVVLEKNMEAKLLTLKPGKMTCSLEMAVFLAQKGTYTSQGGYVHVFYICVLLYSRVNGTYLPVGPQMCQT